MLSQSLSLALMLGPAAGLFVAILSGDLGRAVQAAGLLASAALVIGAYLHGMQMYHQAQSRVRRFYWLPSSPLIEAENHQLPEPAPPVHDIKLIPVHTRPGVTLAADVRPVEMKPRTLLDGVEQSELTEFIDQLPVRGHSKRRWDNYRFKSGRVCDAPYYDLLIGVLTKINAIVDREERKTGKRTLSPAEIKRSLGLAA